MIYDTDTYDSLISRIAGDSQDINVQQPRIIWHLQNLPVNYCLLTPHQESILSSLRSLYSLYSPSLHRVRSQARQFRRTLTSVSGAQSDGFADLEAEILYMRIRSQRPERVAELSPNCGWSTWWILRALEDNGFGALDSFDLHDCAERVLLAEGAATEGMKARWSLHVGDAFKEHLTPDNADLYDYLFIDSEHSYEFASRVIRSLLSPRSPSLPLRGGVHDAYNDDDKPSPEWRAYLEFFAGTSGNRTLLTPSPYKNIALYAEIVRMRIELGLGGADEFVAPCKWTVCANGMVFFDLFR